MSRRSRYVTVEVTEEVDVSIEDIVAGMDDEDMRRLRDYLTERLAARDPQAHQMRDLHQEAVRRRHDEHHPGPLWLCPDQICATSPEEES